ncbi:MAG: hypothetical protein L3J07_02440 [Candidatus Magasanikbacteria bacterium]|nr:hypothetical protein [Candidatus Magasanikbacteria bacterium]
MKKNNNRIPAFQMVLGILDYCFLKMIEGGCTIDPLIIRVEICFVLLANVQDNETDFDVLISELESLLVFTEKYNFSNYAQKLKDLLELFKEEKDEC